MRRKLLAVTTTFMLSMAPYNVSACANCCAESAAMQALDKVMQQTHTSLNSAMIAAHQALDTAVTTGESLHAQQANISYTQIVDAVVAASASSTTEHTKSRKLFVDTQEALKNGFERLEKSRQVSEESYYSGTSYGSSNIPLLSKLLFSHQSLDIDGLELLPENIIYLVDKKKQVYMDDIYSDIGSVAEEDLWRRALLISESDQFFSTASIPEEQIPIYTYAARLLALPPGLVTSSTSSEANLPIEYQSLKVRARSVAEFMAWDIALRGEMDSGEGTLSPLVFLKQIAFAPMERLDILIDTSKAGDRKLLNTLELYRAINNWISIIELESARYKRAMLASMVGIRADESLDGMSRELRNEYSGQ